jgi:GT2 family glycosyltransferase
MWRCEFFTAFLNDLLSFPAVGQVIVINNDIKSMPRDLPLHHPKFKMMLFGHNIGVNPAWNIGVKESKYDKICIANDDVVFDSKIFNRVDTVLGPDSGVIGICPGVKEFNQPAFISGIGRIIPWSGQHTHGFGCLMFVHKSWYKPVPDGLKIYYGDNWIFETCLVSGRTNYLITDSFFYTPFATTTGTLPNVMELHSIEQPIYQHAIAKFQWDVIISNEQREIIN